MEVVGGVRLGDYFLFSHDIRQKGRALSKARPWCATGRDGLVLELVDERTKGRHSDRNVRVAASTSPAVKRQVNYKNRRNTNKVK